MDQNSDWLRHLGIRPDIELRLRTTTYVIRRGPDLARNDIHFIHYLTDGVQHDFDHIPYEQNEFAWATTLFWRAETSIEISVFVGGKAQVVEREKVTPGDQFEATGPIWCPTANMTRERPYGPGGSEIKHGSKHFAPGAKLHILRVVGGAAHTQVRVIGRHRASHRYVTMIVRADWLTNWRVDLVYSPHVISEVWPAWDGSVVTRARAEEFVNLLSPLTPE